MSKIKSAVKRMFNSKQVHLMCKFLEKLIALCFYSCFIVAIASILGDIFYIASYKFAAKELFLSIEITVIMLMLYWAAQQAHKTVYRILWIVLYIKIMTLFMLVPNYQKVIDFEVCYDLEYCKSFVYDNINQETCLADGGAWNIDDKICDYRYNSKDECPKLKGKWLYPKTCKNK